MKLIFIVGDAASGKMTVGNELSKQIGYVLFHNHITIEPVLKVLGKWNSSLILELREVFFKHMALDNEVSGIIFTMMLDFNNPSEFLYLEHLEDIVREYRPDDEIEFYLIELDASLETRLNRNQTEFRLQEKESKRDIEKSNARLIKDSQTGRFVSDVDEVPYENYLRIVNDELSVEEQVNLIRSTFNI